MGYQEGTLSLLVALCCLLTPSWGLGFDNKNCTFGPGICPVTKENVVDVFYFDVVDDFSCQEHCKDLEECHFFTMYGIKDSPKDHMKCFMFKTCDHKEPCPECTSGIPTSGTLTYTLRRLRWSIFFTLDLRSIFFTYGYYDL